MRNQFGMHRCPLLGDNRRIMSITDWLGAASAIPLDRIASTHSPDSVRPVGKVAVIEQHRLVVVGQCPGDVGSRIGNQVGIGIDAEHWPQWIKIVQYLDAGSRASQHVQAVSHK